LRRQEQGVKREGSGDEQRLAVREVGLALLYLGLGLVSGLVWARLANLQALPQWHLEMILGQAPAPNQYRPLTPWLAQLLVFVLPGRNLFVAYLLVRSLVTGATLLLFDRYMRVWFSPAAAAAGALCIAAILPFTYLHVVQESDPINLLVFVVAFWALARGRDALLFPLVLVGTLNRETTAMVPALYLVARWGRRPMGQVVWRTAALVGAWALIYLSMVWVFYGRREYYCEVMMWRTNVESWTPTIQVLLVFGVMWVLAFAAAKRGPLLLLRALWLLPPFVILHYLVAMVREVRLFLPLAPLVIPLAWCVLLPEARQDEGETEVGQQKG
jgi:hypothetical protein